MKQESLIIKIQAQVIKFKQRADKSPQDLKRHDLIKKDEQKWMYTAYTQLGWSFAKIGSVFGRDPRSVKRIVETYRLDEEQTKKSAVNQDTLIFEARRKHQFELRHLLSEWMKQIPPPSKLPYVAQGWLRDEMPKERLYELLEQPDTTKLFEDALEMQEQASPPLKDYYLPIESDPEFTNLCQHLVDYPVVENYDTLKRQSAALSFEYGILIGVITQDLSAGVIRQHYGQELLSISSYEEMVRISLESKTTAIIIGIMLSCDLLTSALDLASESFRVAFVVSLRETRSAMALALSYIAQNHSQLGSDLTNLGKILCKDQNDPTQVQKRTRKILKLLGQSQQLYDRLRTDFQSILNKEPFPGQCSACRYQ